jgi:hypothetical protein
VVYNQLNSVVNAEEEGTILATVLDSKKAALLQYHDVLSVRKSIEETIEESGPMKTF